MAKVKIKIIKSNNKNVKKQKGREDSRHDQSETEEGKAQQETARKEQIITKGGKRQEVKVVLDGTET